MFTLPGGDPAAMNPFAMQGGVPGIWSYHVAGDLYFTPMPGGGVAISKYDSSMSGALPLFRIDLTAEQWAAAVAAMAIEEEAPGADPQG